MTTLFTSGAYHTVVIQLRLPYVAKLRAENDQLQLERAEAGEAAAKLLDEMKELVTEMADKLQGPPRTSPFAREARVSPS